MENIYLALFHSVGNWWMIGICILLFMGSQIAISAGDYYIIHWTTHGRVCYEDLSYNGTNNPVLTYSKICSKSQLWRHTYTFGGLVALAIVGIYLKAIIFGKICKNTGNRLHASMFQSMIQGSMCFFYKNRSAFILSRFSRDMGIVDRCLPLTIHDALLIGFVTMSLLSLTIIVNYWLVLPMIITGSILYLLTRMYFKVSSTLKQMENTRQSSVLETLMDTLNGLVTIRTFEAEDFLTKEFHRRQDEQTRIATLLMQMSRGFQFYMEVILALYLTIVCYVFILARNLVSISDVGLILTQSLATIIVARWIQVTEMNSEMSSVKRIIEFAHIDQENCSEVVSEKEPHPNWPTQGFVEFRNVSFRYSRHDRPTLMNINFTVAPGQKIGIVGRTGAGKSSLIAALFRLGFIDGDILIDGLSTSQLHLHKLRSKISIIPQESHLFAGTLRDNLDPFGNCSDADIFHALDTVGLIVNPEGLKAMIDTNGTNFNVRQRQLICLARAFVKRNKILILDEAKANLDPGTDDLIQRTIDSFRDCTIFFVAHRLSTVMNCDRIIVLSGGKLVEFGHPLQLLKKKNGIFSDIVKSFMTL